MSHTNKGFSLVELIIVIAIMAVLVGVLAPQFIKYVESSRQSTDIDNLAEYKSSIEAVVSDLMSEGCDTSGIVISVSTTEIAVTGNSLVAERVAELGLATTPLKSSGWVGGSAEYDDSSYSWSYDTGLDTPNEKKPHKVLSVVFYLSNSDSSDSSDTVVIVDEPTPEVSEPVVAEPTVLSQYTKTVQVPHTSDSYLEYLQAQYPRYRNLTVDTDSDGRITGYGYIDSWGLPQYVGITGTPTYDKTVTVTEYSDGHVTEE